MTRTRFTFTVRGIVQGVGFRPFVLREARALGLDGSVVNTSSGVIIIAEGEKAICLALMEKILASPPPGAMIFSFDKLEQAPRGEGAFRILPSVGGAAEAAVSPDLGICADCERELLDKGDRRYMYPFLNCTACGPRFTIIKRVPYDRANTSMANFPMCAPCEEEYHCPQNRRFHAQPTACRDCGPRLFWLENGARDSAGGDAELIERFKRYVLLGRLVAVKGLGGFHLACDATNAEAVARLRKMKRRYEKPLAVMMRDILEVEARCFLSDDERNELLSARKPILLLKKRGNAGVADAVAPENDFLGVMLPYTPLHVLLTRDMPPLVMTSANISEAPMPYKDEDTARAASLCDAVLTHNRPILRRMDDSVAAFVNGRRSLIRRARGFAPEPVIIKAAAGIKTHILAFGAQQKNTFCLAKGEYAYISGHIGDLYDADTYDFYGREIEAFLALFGGKPEALACDMHPDYASTRMAREWAQRLPEAKNICVQHHHAHFASVLGEYGLERAQGFIFDGSGYGADGTLWGGELLLGGAKSVERAAHLRRMRLIGGDTAAREPWRVALYAVTEAVGAQRALELFDRPEAELLLKTLSSERIAPSSSSMGRLFDAVAAIASLCPVAAYEGQAAVALEQAYDKSADGRYDFSVTRGGDGCAEWDWRPVIQGAVRDIGLGAGVISARFHRAVTALVEREADKDENAVLSGGVFQNKILLHECVNALEKKGVSVYINQKVPANDGGVCFGQAVAAGAAIS